MGLPISGVAKDREDFDSSHISTTKFLHKIRLTADLKGDKARDVCQLVCSKACNLQSVQVKQNTKKILSATLDAAVTILVGGRLLSQLFMTHRGKSH